MNYSEMVLDRILHNSTLQIEGRDGMSDNPLGTRNTQNQGIISWVERMAQICQPEQVFWCDGSVPENEFITRLAAERGVLIPLDQEKWPGCYYHRSEINDVARVEQCTYICTPSADEAGPTNNWAAPADMYSKLYGLAQGAMRGRRMYVVPYLMGPPGSSLAKVGIELTDSIYVVLSMRIMTRMGEIAYRQLGESEGFNRGLHCMLDVSPERRYIAHFPQDNTIISVGSNYGGNVLSREEMSQFTDRLLFGRARGLDGRTYADPRGGRSSRRKDLRGGGFSECLRKDQFRNADSAQTIRGMEGLDGWR